MKVTEPLYLDILDGIPERYHRVLTLDPAPFYQNIYNKNTLFSHYKRWNFLCMDHLFPQIEKELCACGCGQKLSGRRTRWATDECQEFALQVYFTIQGKSVTIRRIVALLSGDKCFKCGITDNEYPRRSFDPEKEDDFEKREILWNKEMKELSNKIHLDHIVPVHQGGGGCWLSNYQLLCERCHKIKTKEERK